MRPQPARATRSRRLSPRRLAFGVLAVPLVVSPLATSAQETDSADTPSPAAATDWTVLESADAGPAPKGEDVTLITGDTVRVTTTADGGQNVTVTPAPGTGETGFLTHEEDGDFYVVPTNLAALIPERLDPSLFNVTELVESGLTDTQTDAMPVIVTYQQDAPVPAAARAVDGDALELQSVNGLGLAVDKTDDTPDVAAALEQLAGGANPNARSAGSGALAGLEKIWLDHPVEAMLDESVPQIGAPEAWDLGFDGAGTKVAVLDSGIDEEHPDLAGQVVARGNFSESDTTDDLAGHGTHVASTIAGTGAASDGRFVGVAPGASLINAKVLDDHGNGSTSGVIEGMEWAAEQGADVINMSLGVTGFYSDGTDPGSMAVNTITEEHGTLFVIAAGNEGPRDGTVTSPGAADLALTVGAVDDNEDIAYFSSRGPRAGDHAVKPEITGPGVDIVAARAGGTNPMFPFDDNYAYMSGTSMATPHVAGAAALLAQARPELEALELKSMLVGTAVSNDDLRVLDQGAGRVNVPTALTGEAIAEPVAMDLGSYGYPQEPGQTEKIVTYRNLGEAPLTLDLAASARNEDGEPAGEGALTVAPATLTIPAGDSATATVTVDVGVEGAGQFSGAVVATSGSGQTLSTPISWYKEPERYNVHVEGIARDGREAQGTFRVFDVVDGSVSATRNWGQSDNTCTTEAWGASNCIRLAPGDYSFSGMIQTMPADLPALGYPGQTADFLNTSFVVEPEVTIDGETTLTLDAREAVEVQIETPGHETRPVNGSPVHVQYHRVSEEGAVLNHGLVVGPRTQLDNTLFMTPTEPVEHGQLTAYTQWTLEAPDVTLQVEGHEALDLEPHYYDRYWFSDNSWQFPQLEGEHSLTVMDVGTATPEELDGVDLSGTLALVRSSDDIPVAEQSNNAAAAGASMVAVYHDKPGSDAYPGASGIRLEVPTVRLSHEEGTALLELVSPGAALAKERPKVLAMGQPASPYRYSLRLTEEGNIPDELDYVLETEDLGTVTNTFHRQLGNELTLTETWYARAPWQNSASGWPIPTVGGERERVDYYIADPDLEYSQHVTTPEERYNYNWPADPQALLRLSSQYQTYEPGERLERSWMAGPLRPGLWPQEAMVRTDGDSLDIRLAAFVDGSGNTAMASGSSEDGFDVTMRVIADGEEVIESNIAYGTLAIPADATDYRVEYEVDNNAPWAQLSRHAKTVWTYQSAPPAEGEVRVEPLLTVDYDLDVDLHNRLPAPSDRKGPLTVGFTVGHQEGAPDLPVENATLDVSYDGGDTWRAIKNLREVEGNQFVANLPSNLPKGNDGTLSLRMSATDSAGSTVEQEVLRAAGLPE